METLTKTHSFFTMDISKVCLVTRLGECDSNPVQYLIQVFKRLEIKQNKEQRKSEIVQSIIERIEELKKLIMSYFGLIVSNDDIFPKIERGPTKLLKILVEKDKGIFKHLNIYTPLQNSCFFNFQANLDFIFFHLYP